MPDNIVLIMRFHPVGGEDVTVVSEDFGEERQALEAIAQALDERRSLVLTHARYGRETGPSGVIINLANVVAVRVSKTTAWRRASTCDSWPGEGENAATWICLRLRRAAARGEPQTSCRCWTRGSLRSALRAVTAARSYWHRAFRRDSAATNCRAGNALL